MDFGRFSDATLSNADQVARAIGSDILAGTFLPGDKLPAEADMLARFGVSRTVLREAFKTLTAKGLIVSRTRIGTIVCDSSLWNFFDKDILAWKVAQQFDLSFIRDLAAVRTAIEPAAAQSAAERATAGEIEKLRAILGRMEAATSDAGEFAEADLEFHKAIGAASGNVLMRSLSAVIETALLASFRMSSPVKESTVHSASVKGHGRIVDAIEKRDGLGAAKAMRAIIAHGVGRIEDAQPARRRKVSR